MRKLWAVILLGVCSCLWAQDVFILPFKGTAAQLSVTFDAASGNATTGTKKSYIAFQHTVANQSNRYFIVATFITGSTRTDSVKFGSQKFTLIRESARDTRQSVFGLIAPTVATDSVRVYASSGGNAYIMACGTTYYNVHQTTPVGTARDSSVTSVSPGMNVVCTSANEVAFATFGNFANKTHAPRVSSNERGEYGDTSDGEMMASYDKAGAAGTVEVGATITSTAWLAISFRINPP